MSTSYLVMAVVIMMLCYVVYLYSKQNLRVSILEFEILYTGWCSGGASASVFHSV